VDASSKELLDLAGADLFVLPQGTQTLFQDLFQIPLHRGREITEGLMAHPDIEMASPILAGNGYISANKTHEDEDHPRLIGLSLSGKIPELDEGNRLSRIVSGTDLPTRDDPFFEQDPFEEEFDFSLFTHEIVINEAVAESLEVDVGDTVYVSSSSPSTISSYNDWLNNSVTFKITGIQVYSLEGAEDFGAVMHLSELQYLLHLSSFDTVSYILVFLSEDADPQEMKSTLTDPQQFEYADRITIETKEDIQEQLVIFTSFLQGFSQMISIVAATVSVLFLTTIMMMSVKERSGEIGILRATGISRRTIVSLVIAESLLICILGLIFGLLLGFGTANAVDILLTSSEPDIPQGVHITDVSFGIALLASAFTLTVGVAAGAIPAFWAASMKPVESIRSL